VECRLPGPKLMGDLTFHCKRFLMSRVKFMLKEKKERGSRIAEKLWREMFTWYIRKPASNSWS